MNLESPKVTVAKSAQNIFDLLTNIQNFEKLMPENTSKFEVTAPDAFIFGLKGMPEIKLKLKEQTPHSKIVLGAASDKLPFTLQANLESIDDSNTQVQLIFNGDFNPMMAMMIKGPITKFIEALSANMTKL